jgi:hypothetical protein
MRNQEDVRRKWVMVISQTIGIDMPEDFPTTAHNGVNDKLKPCQPRNPNVWSEYGSGWNAIAFRFSAATDADATFTTSLKRPASSLEEYEIQEKALFAFFVTGYAAIESFSYALFAVGALLDQRTFPMSTPEQLKAVTPRRTLDKFAARFAGKPVVLALSALVNDPALGDWHAIRNVLAHRAAPPRQHNVTIHEGASSGENAGTTSSTWLINANLVVTLDEQTTSNRRAWLARHLTACVQATEYFVIETFP